VLARTPSATPLGRIASTQSAHEKINVTTK
jgi:hypothetical protein